MNLEEINDQELQNILLHQIHQNEPILLNDLLTQIISQLNLPQTNYNYWTTRIIFIILNQMHQSKTWLSAYQEKQGKRHEFKTTFIDPPPHDLFLETTSTGLKQIKRLARASAKKQSTAKPKQNIYAVKTIRQLVKTDKFRKPKSVETAKKQIIQAITSRRGQQEFRQKLLDTYQHCLVTGCKAQDALEAAHIRPYAKDGNFCLSNGLLLRADIHTLFDLGLIVIDTKGMKIIIAPTLRNTEYKQYAEKPLKLSDYRTLNQTALDQHRREAISHWQD